ncbi:MAG: hypothetical protein CL797_08865 [Chromatiales bacterium]|jgi:hypothetical protein|nr:hypothetical protein [Chromatiales bacterium]
MHAPASRPPQRNRVEYPVAGVTVEIDKVRMKKLQRLLVNSMNNEFASLASHVKRMLQDFGFRLKSSELPDRSKYAS